MSSPGDQPPTWFGDYLRSLSDEQLFLLLYDGMRTVEFRSLLSRARRHQRRVGAEPKE